MAQIQKLVNLSKGPDMPKNQPDEQQEAIDNNPQNALDRISRIIGGRKKLAIYVIGIIIITWGVFLIFTTKRIEQNTFSPEAEAPAEEVIPPNP